MRKAFERAQTMKSEAKDSVELEKAQALVDRQAVRLKVLEVRKSHLRRR